MRRCRGVAEELVMPKSQSCESCGKAFAVSDADLAFYRKVSPSIGGVGFRVPPPTRCVDCRQRRRLSYRNERQLYRRQCDATGESILSTYAPGTGLTVYQHHYWFSDAWDALSYGREFDFTRPFFEQFFELHNSVPLMSLDVKSNNENCDYTHLVSGNKDCYLIFAASDNRDCRYTTFVHRCQDVADCFFIFDSERCYQCVDCYNCYNLRNSQYCQHCADSSELYNCRGCRDCYGCVSLMNKQYCLFNQQLTRGEYQRRLAELSSASGKSEIAALRRRLPQKCLAGIQNENVSGDHISYSKNCESCFDCTYLEDCRYCTWLHRAKDCADCYGWGYPGELGYESHLIGNNFYRVLFSESCWGDVSNLLYCRYCLNGSRDLLGCMGLRKKQHCILNVQYGERDYQRLAARILAHMQETGEWGQFFPMSYSPYAYNETMAREYYPRARAEVLAEGLRYKDDIPFACGNETLSWGEVPGDIAAVPDSILHEVLACEECGRNYRLIAAELAFYRSMGLAVPHRCFECRHQARFRQRNPRVLYERFCEHCGERITTTFSPESPDVVFCESCYLTESGPNLSI